MYSLILCGVILLLGGAGFRLLDPGVHSFAEGLWLAFTTAATVGYGDMVPSTHASRMFAVIVVLLGLAVLSLATASLAAIFVEKDVEEGEERQIEHELLREIGQLREDVRRLQQEIHGNHATGPDQASRDAAGPRTETAVPAAVTARHGSSGVKDPGPTARRETAASPPESPGHSAS